MIDYVLTIPLDTVLKDTCSGVLATNHSVGAGQVASMLQLLGFMFGFHRIVFEESISDARH